MAADARAVRLPKARECSTPGVKLKTALAFAARARHVCAVGVKADSTQELVPVSDGQREFTEGVDLLPNLRAPGLASLRGKISCK